MKSVMISIHPKWCEKIASLEKTVEIRKTRPKLKTPFKCYIYCTKDRHNLLIDSYPFLPIKGTEYDYIENLSSEEAKTLEPIAANGYVIGEFVCDEIRFANAVNLVVEEDAEAVLDGSCLTTEDVLKYLGVKKGTSRYDKKCEFYRWHISDLVIYNEPRKLGEYKKYNRKCFYEHIALAAPKCKACTRCQMTRPPQSWCYVEEGAE